MKKNKFNFISTPYSRMIESLAYVLSNEVKIKKNAVLKNCTVGITKGIIINGTYESLK